MSRFSRNGELRSDRHKLTTVLDYGRTGRVLALVYSPVDGQVLTVGVHVIHRSERTAVLRTALPEGHESPDGVARVGESATVWSALVGDAAPGPVLTGLLGGSTSTGDNVRSAR
jgi:hypothetical protein